MAIDEKERRYYKTDLLHKIFALSSALLLCSVIWLVVNDYNAEWKYWQKRFYSLEESEHKDKSSPGIKNTPEYQNKQDTLPAEQYPPVAVTAAAYIRDMPLLDFLNPSLKLDQITLRDFAFDLKFAKASRVDRCVSCHIPVTNPKYKKGEVPLKTHPGPKLFLSFGSPHPLRSFGCSVCHQGRDRGTSFSSSTHFPDTREAALEWEEKYGWKPMKSWRFPMIPLRYIESSCLRCHEQENWLQGAAKLNEGRRLVKKLGCRGCHTIPVKGGVRKTGPSLRKISAKLNRRWVKEWILNPVKNNRHTAMPAFFPSGGELTRKEVSERLDNIVEFLFYQSEAPVQIQPPPPGNFEKGLRLFASIGCTACHPVPGEQTGDQDNLRSLFNLQNKVGRTWLFNWLREPRKFAPQTLMPDFRLSETESANLTEYLLHPPDGSGRPIYRRERIGDTAGPQKRIIERGRELVSRYGCFGCHDIKGFENRPPVGPDLGNIGSKPVRYFDFGLLKGEIESSRHSWLFEKIRSPRSFSSRKGSGQETLIMPLYRLNDEQSGSILTFLLGLTSEKIPEQRKKRLSEEESIKEKALKIIEERHCLACHTLNGQGGTRRANIATAGQESTHLLPPSLDGEGGMVRPQWLFNFLKNPSPVRPWLEVRMPNFHLSDMEVETLVTFFSISAGRRTLFDETRQDNFSVDEIRAGKEIFSILKCNSCHITVKKREMAEGEIGPDLTLAKNRLRPAWIKRWLREPRKLKKGTRMPTNWVKITRRGKTIFILPPSLKHIFKGDVKKQISAVTAYILTL